MTADQLLQNIKDRAALPPAQIVITDTKILQAATEELQAWIAPLLSDLNEEFFTDSADTAIVSGQAGYDIPARAMGSGLRALKWVDANGNEGAPINRIELSDIGNYASLASSTPLGFYATATQVVILPTPSASSGSLRMYYSRRPGALVSDVLVAGAHTQVLTITGFNFVDDLPSAICSGTIGSPFAAGAIFDVSGYGPPYRLKHKDQAVNAIVAGNRLQPVSDLFTAATTIVAAGDYITLANTSYVPQIPLEWHSLLELRTVARVFAMLGDGRSAQEALMAAGMMEKRLTQQADPRFNVNPRKINAWRR